MLGTEINGSEVVIYVERTRNDIYIHRLVTTLSELDEQEASVRRISAVAKSLLPTVTVWQA